LRNELISAYQNQGLGYLQERMLSLNPEKLKKMDSNNPQRLMRAIELEMQGGLVVKKAKARPFKVVKIGLNMQRELLYERINQRVDVMMNMGLLNEVNALLPYREVNAMQTVGYSELVEHIDGLMTLEQAVDKIKQHTRNYAKRQMTWFRADEGIHWFEPNKTDDIELFVKTEAAKKSS
jgi:tRNA dimethylallyltransferase